MPEFDAEKNDFKAIVCMNLHGRMCEKCSNYYTKLTFRKFRPTMNSCKTSGDFWLRNGTFLGPGVSFLDIKHRTLFWVTFWRDLGPKKGFKVDPGASLLTEHLPLGGLLGVHVGLHATHRVLRVPTFIVWGSFWLIRGLLLGDFGVQNETCWEPEVLVLTSKLMFKICHKM